MAPLLTEAPSSTPPNWAEWLRLQADEVAMLARAGVLPRNADGQFPLVRCIQGFLKLEEARATHARAAIGHDARRSPGPAKGFQAPSSRRTGEATRVAKWQRCL
jgi:hypothetical protein